MCTLSFIPESDGYVVAMNRDERISRPAAFPPRYTKHGKARALYPHEKSGGTWIAASDYGVTLALLNWNSPAVISKQLHSRGRIIPALIGSDTPAAMQIQLEFLDLSGTLPFRLIAISPTERGVYEWRWNQERLQRTKHGWRRRHWFSSSASDELAAEQRGRVCTASTLSSSSSPLRNLHASHENGPGAFSICVHRSGVETVSYSEVIWLAGHLNFFYHQGPPCAEQQTLALSIL